MFGMKQVGMKGNVHDYIQNWLNNRKQKSLTKGVYLCAPVHLYTITDKDSKKTSKTNLRIV